MKRWVTFLLGLICLFGIGVFRFGRAEIFFHETFDTLENWVPSLHREDYGKVGLTGGSVGGESTKKQGLKLLEKNKQYALSRKLPRHVNPSTKDLVISFSLKTTKELACGGTHIKLFSEDFDPKNLSSDSPFLLLFGSDRCPKPSYMRIVKSYKGKPIEWSFKDRVPEDELTHFYTLVFYHDNKYSLFIDGVYLWRASIEKDWKLLPPRTLVDPTDVKPQDWEDKAVMPDPASVKPPDWDDSQPMLIPDMDAKPSHSFDPAFDGEWVRPTKRNPLYKGAWIPRYISNPKYKGPWIQKRIPNPEYVPDPTLYQLDGPIAYVAIELWTVEEGSVFGDIMIGDDEKEVINYVRAEVAANRGKEKAIILARENAAKRFVERHKADVNEATKVFRALEVEDADEL